MISFSDIVGHIFNLIYIIGFLVKKIIWLRIIMIIGAIIEIYYYLLIGESQLWVNLFWCFVWIIVNGVQLFILLREKWNLKFTDKEKILYNLSFKAITEEHYRKLLDIAEWNTYPEKTTLIEEGVNLEKLIFIHSGVAKVESKGKILAFIGDGNFAGEMSFISKGRTSADVISETPIECLCWDREKIEKLFRKYKELEEGLKTILNLDLVKKLSAAPENY